MKFGEKIKVLRTNLGISPELLAMRSASENDDLSVSGGYIRRIESGAVKSPTLDTAVALARGLGVPVSVLIDTDELEEEAIKDLDLANFFRTELPKLKEEDKKLLRHSINIIREKAKEEYNAEK